MTTSGRHKKRGPVSRAFLKGLSILLPAVITIAIFAWVWDILRVYVVELTIQGIDVIQPFEPRKLTDVELAYLDDSFFTRNAEGQLLPRTEANLRREVRISDLPVRYQGLSPPNRERSILQFILDSNALAANNGEVRTLWTRDYDVSGRIISYNWFDYLLASVLGLVIVVLLGFLARNFLGRRFVQLLEWFVTRVPVIKSIYPHAKQLVDFFFTDNKPLEFDTVAILEYPRRGLWSIVFVTGSGIKSVQEYTRKRMVTVYVPSSPAPMTGYTMVVAAEEVIQLNITVEEAMKFVISGGVLAPLEEQVKPASGAQYALAGGINEQIRHRHTTILRREAEKKARDTDIKKKADDEDTKEVEKPAANS
ncbi:MAG: DUF502 domain-containing protein [Planctomycetes bacterium]|nr:DUF502 domain-containing protein [Planctomycetota bacterium]MCW8134641.1 DUF502 domain-containing protein [Planctomycetota bacterium]